MNWSGSPTAATGDPSGATATTEPRWIDSTRSPRVTSTRTGGAAVADRRPALDEVGRLLAAAALSGRLTLALLGAGLLATLALALAEDASTTRRGALSLRGLRAGLTGGRCRARAGLASHRHAALPVGAFLDHEHLCLDVALDPAGRADLEATAAFDVTLVVAVDDHVVRLDRAADAGLRADDQGSLAFELTLRLALDPQVAVADGLPVEAGMGIDDALVAALIAAGELAG